VLAKSQTVTIPELDPSQSLVELQTIAEALLRRMRLVPVLTRNEAEARALARKRDGKSYPILLTPLDTGGEKPFEEFVAADETHQPWLPGLGLIQHRVNGQVDPMLFRFSDILGRGGSEFEIASSIVEVFRDQIHQFHHRSSTRNLDQRL
jgi:hypothetical protein